MDAKDKQELRDLSNTPGIRKEMKDFLLKVIDGGKTYDRTAIEYIRKYAGQECHYQQLDYMERRIRKAQNGGPKYEVPDAINAEIRDTTEERKRRWDTNKRKTFRK